MKIKLKIWRSTLVWLRTLTAKFHTIAANKKKNNKPKRESFASWVKTNIIGIITIFIAIPGVYIAYKAYIDSKPPRLSIEFWNQDECMNVEDVVLFKNLIFPHDEHYLVPYLDYKNLILFGGHYRNASEITGIPFVSNYTNKRVKNLRLEIRVNYSDKLILPPREISEDFEIKDNKLGSVILKYKHDILYAKSAIPMPIRFMYLPESEEPFESTQYFVNFVYSISYDGMARPITFRSFYDVYFDNELGEKHIDDYLTECYQLGLFSNTRKTSLVSIIDIDKGNYEILNPPKRLTNSEFEQYKKTTIENWKSKDEKLNNLDEEYLISTDGDTLNGTYVIMDMWTQ